MRAGTGGAWVGALCLPPPPGPGPAAPLVTPPTQRSAAQRPGVRRPEDGCACRGPPAPRPPGRAHPEQGAGAGGGARSRGGGGGLGRWGRGGTMAPGGGGFRAGALERRVSMSSAGWARAGGSTIFEGWGPGLSAGCRRLVRACQWALGGGVGDRCGRGTHTSRQAVGRGPTHPDRPLEDGGARVLLGTRSRSVGCGF